MEGVAELGEVEGIKTVAGMYCMRGESVFNKRRKKNDFLSSRSKWLLITSQFGLRRRSMSSCFFCAGISTLLILYRQPQLLWVHECNGSVMFRRHCFSLVLTHPWLLQSFCFLFCNGPWPLGKWCDAAVSFVAENAAETYSLHFDHLWIFVSTTILCTKCSLMKVWELHYSMDIEIQI